MNQFEKVKELLLRFSNLGLEESDVWGGKLTLIGKAPHVGSWARINIIYPVVTFEEIDKIEDAIDKTIPEPFVLFLTECSNGLNIMANTMCVYGYRYNYVRDYANVMSQPYSVIEANTYMKPRNSTDDMFFIGGYEWDGSLLYMTPDGRVHFCRRHDATSLQSWDSLDSMLISEIERLYTLFDCKGVQIDESQPTTPV